MRDGHFYKKLQVTASDSRSGSPLLEWMRWYSARIARLKSLTCTPAP